MLPATSGIAASAAPVRSADASRAVLGGDEQERQQQDRGELDGHGEHQHGPGTAIAFVQQQRDRRRGRQQHEEVVVKTAHGVDHEHGVERHERHHEALVAAELAGAKGHDPHERQGGQHRYDLERPVGNRQRQPSKRIAQCGEQLAVGARQVVPGGQAVDRVVALGADHVRVRVEVMQAPEPGVAEVVEDVRELQRRAHQHDRQQQNHADPQRAHGERANRRNHDHVGHEHPQQHEAEAELERLGVVGQRAEHPVQRPSHPVREGGR